MNPFRNGKTLFVMTKTKAVSVTAVHESLGERPQIIDVRSPAEFDSGHLPGAVNIPMEAIASRLDDIDLSAPTVLVCQSGTRAGVVCESVGHRFENVAVLEGGTKEWIAQGGSVVRTTRSGLSLMAQSLLGAGIMNLVGVLLAVMVHPAWIGLNAFVSVGLILAGSTGFCMMAIVLSKMPWNKKPMGELAAGRS